MAAQRTYMPCQGVFCSVSLREHSTALPTGREIGCFSSLSRETEYENSQRVVPDCYGAEEILSHM